MWCLFREFRELFNQETNMEKKIGKNKMKKIILLIAIGSVLNLDYARASVILANWTFETYTASATATATGPTLLAEAGLGAGVAVATGVHASSSAVWSSPAGNGSAKSFSANNWTVGDYYQFRASSLGYSGISLRWDQTGSSTGPTNFSLLYSTDSGANFTQFATYAVVKSTGTLINYSDSTTGGSWLSTKTATNTSFSYDFSSITGLDSNSNIVFRLAQLNNITTGSSTVANTGTGRIDNVIITASVPEPSTGALLVLGGAALVAVRSLRKKNS
jgi:hypothetical protein